MTIERNFPHVTRVEVIDLHGRSYVWWPAFPRPHTAIKVSTSLQDEGRTLKVFIMEDKSVKA